MGQLVFQANAGGQTALVGPNPSTSISINIPATNGNMVTTGDSGTVTSTMLASGVYTAPGTIGSGTPNTGAFTTLSASSTVSGTGFTNLFATPPAIGSGTASTGAFTTLSASSTVSGTGFSTYLASPPAIGGTTAAAGRFTTLEATSTLTFPSQSIPKTALPTGSVLQVITDTQPGEQSTTSTSFVDTALSITITPTSATSKIFIVYTGSAGNDGTQESYLTLLRDSTNLGNATTGMMRIWFPGSSNFHFSGMSMSFLDSPATTSATTYKVQFRTNSGTVYISGGNATDSLTVFEIAG
jgi:hypothetical protein